MYALYGHPRYLKFKQKYQQYGPCFQTIFPFLMTMLLVNAFTISEEEARQYILDGSNSYHGRILSDFQSVWKGTVLF